MSEQVSAESGAPKRRRLRGCACFCCGCAVVVLVLLASTVAIWVWRLNRNPNPFPLDPETVIAVPGIPIAFEFVDPTETILVLCLDNLYAPTSAVLARCDVGSGRVMESHALPFVASSMALWPSGEFVAVAGIMPSPDEQNILILQEKGARARPQTLRMGLLRLGDWANIAAVEEPCPADALCRDLARSLRVLAVPGEQAWALGCAVPAEESYKVSLRELATLAERKSEAFALDYHGWSQPIVVAVSPNDPSSLLVGRTIEDRYHWDTWATDTDEHTSYVADVGEGMPRGYFTPQLAMPKERRLPEIVWGRGLSPGGWYAAISVHAQHFAHAQNSELLSALPVPILRENRLRCRIDIRYFRAWQEIASGEIWGEGNQIRAMRFPPVGQRLVTGHMDGTVRIWNLASAAK